MALLCVVKITAGNSPFLIGKCNAQPVGSIYYHIKKTSFGLLVNVTNNHTCPSAFFRYCCYWRMLFVNAAKCFLSRREVDGEQSKKKF
ncbi:MAG: hypothetical protein H0V14_12275 [Chitinophagaceae bacterium]|jgi:hypothetical protein|nr:hypothetical protein [Chitinophagaceae bacterium]